MILLFLKRNSKGALRLLLLLISIIDLIIFVRLPASPGFIQLPRPQKQQHQPKGNGKDRQAGL